MVTVCCCCITALVFACAGKPLTRSDAPCFCACRLDDDDRLDTILNHLRRNARPDTAPAEKRDAQGKGNLVEALQDVRGKVKGLEERLAAKRKISLRS